MSMKMALAKLCACACGGAIMGTGAVQVAQSYQAKAAQKAKRKPVVRTAKAPRPAKKVAAAPRKASRPPIKTAMLTLDEPGDQPVVLPVSRPAGEIQDFSGGVSAFGAIIPPASGRSSTSTADSGMPSWGGSGGGTLFGGVLINGGNGFTILPANSSGGTGTSGSSGTGSGTTNPPNGASGGTAGNRPGAAADGATSSSSGGSTITPADGTSSADSSGGASSSNSGGTQSSSGGTATNASSSGGGSLGGDHPSGSGASSGAGTSTGSNGSSGSSSSGGYVSPPASSSGASGPTPSTDVPAPPMLVLFGAATALLLARRRLMPSRPAALDTKPGREDSAA